MAHLTDLPAELQSQILSYCDLSSLIAAIGSYSVWRQSCTLRDVHPTRRRLLDMYLNLVRSKTFLASRACVKKVCERFDREEYIRKMERQRGIVAVPADFRMYILEWPERAVFDSLWPGMPLNLDISGSAMLFRRRGRNLLHHDTKHFQNMAMFDIDPEHRGREQMSITALGLWKPRRGAGVGTWLVVGTHPLSGCILTSPIFNNEREEPATVALNIPFIDWLSMSAQRFSSGIAEDGRPLEPFGHWKALENRSSGVWPLQCILFLVHLCFQFIKLLSSWLYRSSSRLVPMPLSRITLTPLRTGVSRLTTVSTAVVPVTLITTINNAHPSTPSTTVVTTVTTTTITTTTTTITTPFVISTTTSTSTSSLTTASHSVTQN